MESLSKTLKNARTRLGLSENYLAAMTGQSLSSYGDIEMHRDEWRSVPEFYKVIYLCRLLNIDIMPFIPVSTGASPLKSCSAGKFLKNRRMELGLDRSALSDVVGFDQDFVSVAETSHGISLWPFEVIEKVCAGLDINIFDFVRLCLLEEV